ncbi:unnamed protein product [Periconia digitata]|uniref:Uncharacterized protein n=1 Tax=Periconia digitata TaxID=1303443 RepID=A0A9W4U4B6_9PLEO|nr:unnamed protein product [Periconia digitata]
MKLVGKGAANNILQIGVWVVLHRVVCFRQLKYQRTGDLFFLVIACFFLGYLVACDIAGCWST